MGMKDVLIRLLGGGASGNTNTQPPPTDTQPPPREKFTPNAHERKQADLARGFTPGSQYSSLVGGPPGNFGGGDVVSPYSGKYSDGLMGMIELLKDAEKSAASGYSSEGERDAASAQSARLRNLLGNRIADPGSLVRNQGGSSMGGGYSTRRSGINSSALGAIDSLKNKQRSEDAYQLMRKKQELDLAMSEDELRAQQYQTRRAPERDEFKEFIIRRLMQSQGIF